MGYEIINGRVMKRLYCTYGHVQWWDCGPMRELTRGERANLALSRLEKKKQTHRKIYWWAKQIVAKEWFGTRLDPKGTKWEGLCQT